MINKTAILAVTMTALLSGSALADERDRDRRGDQRYDQRHDDRRYDQRDWRHVPPARYRGQRAYREGYAEGYRDAARRCRHGYRQGSWLRDSRGDWFFGTDDQRVAWADRYDPLRVVHQR